MRKTLRRAVVLGLLAFAAPFAALPLAKPAAAMPEASAPVLPDAVDTPAATPQPVLPAVPELPACVSPLPWSIPRGTVSMDCTVADAIDTPDWLPSMFMALLAVAVRASALPLVSPLFVLLLMVLLVVAAVLPVRSMLPVLPILFVPAVLPELPLLPVALPLWPVPAVLL